MSARGEPGDEDFTGQGGGSGLSPQQTPVIQGAPAEDEFDVIETDDRGNEIGPQRQQPAQDTRLTTDAAGEQPLIRQPQEGEDGQQQKPGTVHQPRSARRRAQNEARDAERRRAQDLEISLREAKGRIDQLENIVSTVQPRIMELGEANIRNQLATIDQQLADENARYSDATRRMAEAMQSSDADALAKALEVRDVALVRKTQLSNTKAAVEIQLKKGGTQPVQTGDRNMAPQQGGDQQQPGFDVRRQPQMPQPLSPRAQVHLQQFLSDYPWYDANGGDVDSATVGLLDKDVYRRGFDPGTQEYWDELDRLMQERLPWKFQDERGGQPPADDRQQQTRQQTNGGNGQQQPRQQAPNNVRRGPPVAATSERSPAANGRRQVKIDPNRKEAMILSGSIDASGRVIDKAKYMRQLKSFEEFDRNNTSIR